MNCDTLPAQGGSYILLFNLPAPRQIVVGRFGELNFPAGSYLYCGSARGPGGIRARVRHHVTSQTRPHWHIDFFKRAARLNLVGYKIGTDRFECIWAQSLEKSSNQEIIAPGFGSSDCSCRTHFFYLTGKAGDLPALLPQNKPFAGMGFCEI